MSTSAFSFRFWLRLWLDREKTDKGPLLLCKAKCSWRKTILNNDCSFQTGIVGMPLTASLANHRLPPAAHDSWLANAAAAAAAAGNDDAVTTWCCGCYVVTAFGYVSCTEDRMCYHGHTAIRCNVGSTISHVSDLCGLIHRRRYHRPTAGRSGLVVTRLPAAREGPGPNRVADKSLCFHENHCDTQLWALAVHWLQCLGRLSLPPSEGR